jgi:hypothetical protein
LIRDSDILERRLAAFRDLPWVLPALTVISMTDEDLDRLGAADADSYWTILSDVVARIENQRRW